MSILYHYCKLGYLLTRGYFQGEKVHSNESYIHSLKSSIDGCGCMVIKFVQWYIPKYELIHSKSSLLMESLKTYYEHCNEHELNFTKQLYLKEFHKELDEDYDIQEVIGSGSIAQVYKVVSKEDGKEYAMKVVHPYIHREYFYFKTFVHWVNWIYPLDSITHIHDTIGFLRDLGKQLNLLNEGINISKFRERYQSCSFIDTPEIYECTENILIMNYMKGANILQTKNEYHKLKSVYYYYIFTYQNLLSNYCHGDLHVGNWFIDTENKKINIFDFGYCFPFSDEEYKSLQDLFYQNDTRNKESILRSVNTLVQFYLKKPFNQNVGKIDVFQWDHIIPEPDDNFTNNLLKNIINECIHNNVLITNVSINCILMLMQVFTFLKETNLVSLDNEKTIKRTKTQQINSSILNILTTHEIFPELQEKIKTEIENETLATSELSMDYSHFDCLKDLINTNMDYDS
jgi:predicted unusual protein kinase regulating ubiquinone biosynthesis (AarF/ABC1/UbiB family)